MTLMAANARRGIVPAKRRLIVQGAMSFVARQAEDLIGSFWSLSKVIIHSIRAVKGPRYKKRQSAYTEAVAGASFPMRWVC